MDKCRLCLKNSNKLRSVFDKEDGVVYIDMITSISNLKIKKDDRLTHLCAQCRQKLKEAFNFKNMIEMCNLILCENTSLKRINFNNLDEIKVKVEIDTEKEICENDSSSKIFENWFNDDTECFCFNNTIIKRVKPKPCAEEGESKALNVYDYVKTFKSELDDDAEPDDVDGDDLDQDYNYESCGDVSNSDDEYLLPKDLKKRKKIKENEKGKENRNTEKIHNVSTKNKNKNETRKLLIKPVFLEDVGMFRTKVEKKERKNQGTKRQTKIKKQMCNVCGNMTTSMKSHILTHTGKKTHKCDKCDKAFYTEAALRAHKKKHGVQRKFKCDQCIAKFIDVGALKRHMAVHNDEKDFVCHICDKRFKRTSNLNRHIIHHNSANKKIKCEQCSMTFFSNHGLKHHLRVHTGERPYRCEMCSQGYSYKHDFNRHCFKKHGVFLKRRKVYVMNEEVLVKERDLMRVLMLRLQGVTQGEDPFKEFEGPQGYKALEQAIKLLETKQLPKYSLVRHIIQHNSANKNIKCEQCSMTFFENTSLKHHLRVHTGERPYRCEMCSQGYSYKHDFNRHCFKKHGVFLKRRKVYVMNEEVLVKERDLMRVLMLRLQGVTQGEDPFKEFEGPQGYKALEQAIKLLETKQLPVDV